MNKYKTFEELKEELDDKFEKFLYEANIELLEKEDKLINILEDKIKECNNYSKYIEKKVNELKCRSCGKTYIATEIIKNETSKKVYKDILERVKSGKYE